MRHAIRLFWTGWIFNLKNLTLSGFFMLNAAILPIFYATIAYFMFRAGTRSGSLLYVSLGAGMMGIWSSVLFGSGGLSVPMNAAMAVIPKLLNAPVRSSGGQ